MVIKIGLIGCSRVSKKKIIPAVKSVDFATINVVGSRSNTKAKEWAKEIGCSSYGNYEDVISSDIDCVYISLPDGLHEEWAIKAAEVGLHVLCEKSSTTSYESAKKIMDTCKSSNTRILECFSFKFHPQHKKVLELIKKSYIGKIHNFIGNFGYPKPDEDNIRLKKELGGGILNDAGCYPIYASRMIFNEEPIGVTSNLTIDTKLGIDISASVLLMYKDKTAFAESGFNRDFKSNYQVWGSEGSIQLDRAYAVPGDLETKIKISKSDKEEIFTLEPIDQTVLMLNAFYKEITNNGNFEFEQDLLAQARVMEAVRISSKMKKFVFVEDVI